MNPNFRKVALIAASLGLVVSLFVALRDDGGGAAQETTAATTATTETIETETETEPETSPATTEAPPTTTEAPPATTQAPPATTADGPLRIRLWVEGGRPRGGIARPSVERGRDVVIVVRSDVADHVHLHGYDILADVAPGRPAQLAFTASVAGRFELELEDRHVLLADLEVRP